MPRWRSNSLVLFVLGSLTITNPTIIGVTFSIKQESQLAIVAELLPVGRVRDSGEGFKNPTPRPLPTVPAF